MEKTCVLPGENPKMQANCLNRIFKKVDEEGLASETFDELKDEFSFLRKVYDIDDQAIVLLAAIVEHTNSRSNMDDMGLARYLGCSNIDVIGFHESLTEMDKKGIIEIVSINNRFYRASNETIKAIEHDKPFVPVKMTGLTSSELFSRFRSCFIKFRRDDIDEDRLIEDLDILVQTNDHLNFCQKVLASRLYKVCDETERRMFYYLCHRYVTHGDPSVEVETLLHFVDTTFVDDIAVRRCINNGNTDLQKSGLVDFVNDDGLADTDSLSLSDEVKDVFLDGVEISKPSKGMHSDLVRAECIKGKELFYNAEEDVQIRRIAGLLAEENYQGIRARLADTGMRKGFSILFYGAPGTGKTASAYELARQTGRDLFVVDVSKLRSKYVGESEKCVKSVFNIYRGLCRTSERAPILLFNEADALFMKRFEKVDASVDQMNNTMQNIILQEMENLDGILIATTNLASNMDTAFERRFLFKVEFHKPETSTRAKIWKSIIGGLSEAEAEKLASRFDLSGGNIENVARKSSIEYVLTGSQPTVDTLSVFCEEESRGHAKTRRIGY